MVRERGDKQAADRLAAAVVPGLDGVRPPSQGVEKPGCRLPIFVAQHRRQVQRVTGAMSPGLSGRQLRVPPDLRLEANVHLADIVKGRGRARAAPRLRRRGCLGLRSAPIVVGWLAVPAAPRSMRRHQPDDARAGVCAGGPAGPISPSGPACRLERSQNMPSWTLTLRASLVPLRLRQLLRRLGILKDTERQAN